jgi:hypothetical protein
MALRSRLRPEWNQHLGLSENRAPPIPMDYHHVPSEKNVIYLKSIGILYFQANPCSKHFVPQPHVPMRETNLYKIIPVPCELAEVRET